MNLTGCGISGPLFGLECSSHGSRNAFPSRSLVGLGYLTNVSAEASTVATSLKLHSAALDLVASESKRLKGNAGPSITLYFSYRNPRFPKRKKGHRYGLGGIRTPILAAGLPPSRQHLRRVPAIPGGTGSTTRHFALQAIAITPQVLR